MTEEKTVVAATDTAGSPRRYSKGRIALAWTIAVAADALQIGGFAFFTFAWPVDEGLDIVVAIALTLLIGWHIAFIPSFIIKSLPFADLAPTWTVAVLLATRGKAGKTTASLPTKE
jgi:hypothetical protein